MSIPPPCSLSLCFVGGGLRPPPPPLPRGRWGAVSCSSENNATKEASKGDRVNYTKRGVVVQLGASPQLHKTKHFVQFSLPPAPVSARPAPALARGGGALCLVVDFRPSLAFGSVAPRWGGVLPCRHPLRCYSHHKGCRQVITPSCKIVNFCLLLEV